MRRARNALRYCLGGDYLFGPGTGLKVEPVDPSSSDAHIVGALTTPGSHVSSRLFPKGILTPKPLNSEAFVGLFGDNPPCDPEVRRHILYYLRCCVWFVDT
jgi:hypothetical protein